MLILTNILCHQLGKIVQILFLGVHSFMAFHGKGTNWAIILERQILIHSGRVLKQCFLHNNMDADWQQFIYYCYLWCNHC